MNYIDKLIEACKKAKEAKPVREIVMEPSIEKGIDKNLEIKSLKKAIYIIEEIEGDTEKTFQNFIDFKKNTDRACSRLNSKSNILYVGSSTSGLQKRLRDHMGNGSKSTYSLHLKHWFKGRIKIIVKVYDLELEKLVLQIIEDDLSDRLKPAFGKQGSNNK